MLRVRRLLLVVVEWVVGLRFMGVPLVAAMRASSLSSRMVLVRLGSGVWREGGGLLGRGV